MMHLESTLNASFTEHFSAVELPYKNEKFSMFLFLPEEEIGWMTWWQNWMEIAGKTGWTDSAK